MSELDHTLYMRRAITLAAHVPDRPFGCVIADHATGAISAEGWNKTTDNPTWHGEIDAINALVAAGAYANGARLVLYTTAEPCPMCMAAILWTGIAIVVFGTSIPFLIDLGWRQIDIRAEEVVRRSPGLSCSVTGGVLELECNELFLAAARGAPRR